MANKIQIKRGLKTKLPTLAGGEFGYCAGTSEVYIGSGSVNLKVADAGYVLWEGSSNTDVLLYNHNGWGSYIEVEYTVLVFNKEYGSFRTRLKTGNNEYKTHILTAHSYGNYMGFDIEWAVPLNVAAYTDNVMHLTFNTGLTGYIYHVGSDRLVYSETSSNNNFSSENRMLIKKVTGYK